MSSKILVVDDEKKVCVLLRMHLAKAGYEVITTSDPEEGLELAKQHKPDLIIADIIMPIMDGWQFCTEVRKSPDIPYAPFMFLTSLVNPEIQNFSFNLGADEYVTKPFQKAHLMERVKFLLRQTEHFRDVSTSKKHNRGRFGGKDNEDLLGLIQYFIISRSSGILKISHGNVQGEIHFSNGHINHVKYGKGRNEGAMVDIIKQGHGEFEFVHEKVSARKIKENGLSFFMEACRIADEQQKT